MGSADTASAIVEEEVKKELQAILSSSLVSLSLRQAKLLEYLCNKTLLGEYEHIKESTVAIEVFDRRSDFDEHQDSIVRVEAHRLRKKLEKYYAAEGRDSRVQIVLSPGSYVPAFIFKGDPGGEPRTEEAAPVLKPELPAFLAPPGAKRPLKIRLAWLPAFVVLATLVAGGIAALRIRAAQSTRRKPGVRLPALSAAVNPAADVRIRAGLIGGAYLDRFGRTWQTDRYFHGGIAEPGPSEFFRKPPDSGIFSTMRSGEFSYDIPLKPGTYELRLYFAERNLADDSGRDGERPFNVSLNGRPLLSDFDVAADSGATFVDVRAFKDVKPESDGMIHLKFAAAYGEPFVNALELVPGIPGHALPIRIRTHELWFADHNGNVWSPDNYFVGGRELFWRNAVKRSVEGTLDPGLYAGERYGNFSYSIPVPDGKYSVTLHFAETFFHTDVEGAEKGGVGTRVFDVYCNGAILLRNFDIFKKVGGFHAIERTFRGIRPNGQGQILLSFSPWKNYASVRAIEIRDE